jgi:ubiquinone/menaquinone biosynthesis C-methylase UbiE
MTAKVINWQASWARAEVGAEHLKLVQENYEAARLYHWSRRYEYPWVLLNAGLRKGQWVLDAAGGDGPLQHYVEADGCQVVNVDIEPKNRPADQGRVVLVTGDVRALPFVDGVFDRVLCVSVLEHVENPAAALPELWRVLRPGGRLLVTFDVASYARWNHTIDRTGAQRLFGFFGQAVPPEPADVLSAYFDEIEPKGDDPVQVQLKCLCFRCDKAI